MASQAEVKQYIAYWFQLGKKVLFSNGKVLQPQTVVRGDRYSEEFESCWQQILDAKNNDCYLEGTNQTIKELLSSSWSIDACSRCSMPVPMILLGIQPPICPCHDLPNWPNDELPKPHKPINSQQRLKSIALRLQKVKNENLE